MADGGTSSGAKAPHWMECADPPDRPARRQVTRSRRVLAILVAAAAAGAIAAAVVGMWNPWRYVVLMPLGDALAAVWTVAFVLLGVAGWLALRSRPLMILTMVAAGWAAATMAIIGVVMDVGREGRVDKPTVEAVSPDGSYEVVRLDYERLFGTVTYLRVRSRNGLLSREADRDLACFPLRDVGSVWPRFAGVRFIGPREVEVRADNGATWTATFDPRALRPTVAGWGCRVT